MNQYELNNENQVEQGDLDDLRLNDEELDGIKGGCGPFHKDDPEQPTGGGGFINNHNETVMNDEDKDLTLLADLEPNSEVVGGAGFGYAVLTVGSSHEGLTPVKGNLQITALTSTAIEPR